MRLARVLGLWLLLASAARAQAREDSYEFSTKHGKEARLALGIIDGGVQLLLVLPSGAWDTALLGLDVEASSDDPWLEIRVDEARIEQHLDPEANGLRWLNLTSLRGQLQPGAAVTLRPHGLRIRGAVATLRLYQTPELASGPILILAPHPDDAEIAAFGLYAQNAARTTIVTVTAGNAGDPSYAPQFGADTSGQYAWKGYLRAVDSVSIPWQGGVRPEQCVNLGYFDGRLAQMHAAPTAAIAEVYGPNTDVGVYRRANLGKLLPSAQRANSWQHLIEDLTHLLRKLKPRVVVMPHPRLDSHSDHQYVAVAAVEALGQTNLRPTFLLYTNHAAANRYPFGPAGSPMTLAPWSGDPLAVQRVLSVPVGPELRRRKLFAIESMHDLRLSPDEQASCAVPSPTPRDYPRAEGASYFRRALRSEETFLVLDRQGVEELVRGFVASPGR
jgi:LmbE family N-acetylglucosaminyl deacetylase